MKANCKVISGAFHTNGRDASTTQMISKESDCIEIVYHQNDGLESFEMVLNELSGNSSSLYKLKKRVSTYVLSLISVIVILFALISSSLYEDLLKKIIFESPFEWANADTISLLFVLLFFFGLVLMPSILDGEGSQFKEALKSWFNKDTRILKRLRLAFEAFDKKLTLRIYNIDLLTLDHWTWRLLMPTLLNHFSNIELYVRSDQKKLIEKRLRTLGCLNVDLKSVLQKDVSCKDCQKLFSSKEDVLFSLMQLSSTNLLQKDDETLFVSLELFEYCGRNFYSDKSDNRELISGFQNFINRCFDDFNLLGQHQSNQVHFTNNVELKDLEEERRRLSYYLRNHIEECLEYFDNPISLLILYYYVKDIVLDEKRTIAILEKLILSIKNKQQYTLINTYWFEIAGEMFDASNIEDFELTNNSLYRKLSIEALNNLKFLFERNGQFTQALLITQYLYEINPACYGVDMCSLYERMGQFDNAYNSLPHTVQTQGEVYDKPTDTQVRYFQRKSWIIVSQRKEDKKEEGLELLKSLEDILFRHSFDNEPLWLWHLYNIKANYAEWNENYEEAIKHYKKCLAIPALGAFEYGATFVNMSIAYRFMFLTKSSQNFDIIDKSIQIGSIGVALKASVGDRDEMPVVLHNQALNILYKIVHQKDKSLIEQVKSLTSEGIEILDNTSSIKRLGIMLCENMIAKTLLGEDTKDIKNRLQQHWSLMDEYEKVQLNMIYDKFVNKGLCEAFQK